MTKTYDLFIIGGGINGCGIARDAAGRGLSVGLAEMNDLGSATSSSSTKLFHGGLRYLEYFEFRLVQKALKEREVLLKAMPHIAWPMRFVLPLNPEMRFDNSTPTSRLLNIVMPWARGRRPVWLIRLGLFLYDHLGGRKILPGTKTLNLRNAPEGQPLKDSYRKAFEYSDVWIDDARLVVLNARDAAARGADIFVRNKVVSAKRVAASWHVTLADSTEIEAKTLVNAGGPFVRDVIEGVTQQTTRETVRLVRGSHIVTRKLYDHDKAYFFQGSDGRIIFAIPYEGEYTLIGTTDVDHEGTPSAAECSPEEEAYLCAAASAYFARAITSEDVVWRYSGVRPLYDDGASSAAAATRDYILSLDTEAAPVLTIFGGKITTYRQLAEDALETMKPCFTSLDRSWTADAPLPGGDFEVTGVEDQIERLTQDYPFLTPAWAARMIRLYGTEAWQVLGAARAVSDLGQDFGATLTEAELTWLYDREWARTAEDVIWRRTKLGLRLSSEQGAAIQMWFDGLKLAAE